MYVHLEDRQINKIAIHVGINDIQRDSQLSIDGLLQNIKSMFLKCKKIDEKYLHFGISLYDQDKHWYFGKKSCYDLKFLQEIRLGLWQ